MTCECCCYERGYEEGKEERADQRYEDQYDEGWNDAMADVSKEGRGKLLALLSALDQRERAANLPTPLYNSVMTFDEVREMIRRELD